MKQLSTDIDIKDISESNLNQYLNNPNYIADNFNQSGTDRFLKSTDITSGRLGAAKLEIGREFFILDANTRQQIIKEGKIARVLIGKLN